MAPGRLWGFDYWVCVQLVSSPVHGFGSQTGNRIHFSISVVTANFCLGIVGGEGLQRHQVLAGFQGLHGVGGFSISIRKRSEVGRITWDDRVLGWWG